MQVYAVQAQVQRIGYHVGLSGQHMSDTCSHGH